MTLSYSRFLFETRPRSKWSSGDPRIDILFRGTVAPAARFGISEADYHDDVQAGIVASLRAVGNLVEEHIRVSASLQPGSTWNYDADAIMKPSCDIICNIIEIKTSLTKSTVDEFDGSEFRRRQWEVIALANVGGIATSDNLRIIRLGLIPKVPLPPMGVLILYLIPGQPQAQRYIKPGAFATQLGL